MKRILSLVFILLTMSVITFAGRMPKEINYSSDKLSLSKNDEMLYDGKLYTGKVVLDEMGYVNFKDGHLDGKTFLDNDKVKLSLNIVNGKLEGDFIMKGFASGSDIDTLTNFEGGVIKAYIASIGSENYNLTFDSNGNANGTYKDNDIDETLNYKDGIAETKDGFILKMNTGDKGDELLKFAFTKSGKLVYESGRGDHMNIKYFEKKWFPILFGELSDEQIKLLEKYKEKLENAK